MAGASVEGEDLMYNAATKGNKSIVDTLLRAGANRRLDYALLVAVEKGHEEIFDSLLNAGANIDNYGALGEACRRGHLSIFDKLLQAGACVNIGDITTSPLVHAMDRKGKAMVLKLAHAGASLAPIVSSAGIAALAEKGIKWDLALIDLVLNDCAETKPEGS